MRDSALKPAADDEVFAAEYLVGEELMRDSALKPARWCRQQTRSLQVGEELMRDSALKPAPSRECSRPGGSASEKSSCATAL